MRLGTSNYWIGKSKNGELFTNIYGYPRRIWESDSEYQSTLKLYRIFKKRTLTTYEKMQQLEQFFGIKANNDHIENDVVIDEIVTESEPVIDAEADRIALQNKVKSIIQSIIDFFSEFEFEPNFRFLNTFAYACNNSTSTAKEYVNNYFNLTDNANKNAINDKMNSIEFNRIIDSLKTVTPTHQINNRFKLFYGAPGTGKTTEGSKEVDNIVVCHSGMLPADLMEDFKFEDGKATFIPSALQNAMVNGKKIMLDEINLLPFESLRFLQTILDGKSEFEYKGKTIRIKEGFMIIGTMNLQVNGCVYSLPEPLVDRAMELKEFKLTADKLVGLSSDSLLRC